MSKQLLINRMNLLRTLFLETKGETKQELRLLNIIRDSLKKLNERLRVYPCGEVGSFESAVIGVDKMTNLKENSNYKQI